MTRSAHGERFYLLGDVLLWFQDRAAPVIDFAFDSRAPRVAAALAPAPRSDSPAPSSKPAPAIPWPNPGCSASLVVPDWVPSSSSPSSRRRGRSRLCGRIVGALLAFAIVYGLSWRGGMNYGPSRPHRHRPVVRVHGSDNAVPRPREPWDTPALFTWLSGSTYGRTWADIAPVALALLVAVPLAFVWTRELDLLALDDDTPRLVGVPRNRCASPCSSAAILAAVSVSAVGVVGFIGLVAPHAARALVGARHAGRQQCFSGPSASSSPTPWGARSSRRRRSRRTHRRPHRRPVLRLPAGADPRVRISPRSTSSPRFRG